MLLSGQRDVKKNNHLINSELNFNETSIVLFILNHFDG